MPLFAVFGAAAQIRLRVNSAHLHPDQIRDRKRRRQRDAESAVAVKQRRILPIKLQSLFVCDEHRHARAVLAFVKDLFGFVIARFEINFGLAIDLAPAGLHVVTIDGRRRGEAGEGIKRLGVFALSAETRRRAVPGSSTSRTNFPTRSKSLICARASFKYDAMK